MVALAASENCERGVIEVGDAKTVGLTLRIIPGKAVWYVRRREVTLRLAEAQYVTLEDARYYAEQIRLAAGRGVDLKKFAKVLVAFAPGRNPPALPTCNGLSSTASLIRKKRCVYRNRPHGHGLH